MITTQFYSIKSNEKENREIPTTTYCLSQASVRSSGLKTVPCIMIVSEYIAKFALR